MNIKKNIIISLIISCIPFVIFGYGIRQIMLWATTDDLLYAGLTAGILLGGITILMFIFIKEHFCIAFEYILGIKSTEENYEYI